MTVRPPTIAVLGRTGPQGLGPGRRFFRADLRVVLGIRDVSLAEKIPTELAEATGRRVGGTANAAAAGAVVLVVVPWGHLDGSPTGVDLETTDDGFVGRSRSHGGTQRKTAAGEGSCAVHSTGLPRPSLRARQRPRRARLPAEPATPPRRPRTS